MSKFEFARVRKFLTRLHRDERGAEGLEKILIIGAIVLPLLGLLLVFRGKITELLTDSWGEVSEDAQNYDQPSFD